MASIESRPVTMRDLRQALLAGFRDLDATPGISVAIAAVYTLGGWLLASMLLVFRLPYLVYPLAMGFALIAPFVAVAFYQVSRCRELGGEPTLGGVWRAVFDARKRELRWMALITSFAFFIWMDIAAMITLSFFGAAALDPSALVRDILLTEDGWTFILVGHVVGAVIALLVFSISVISVPLLFDRDIDVITAIAASVRVVRANPLPMALWCALIALFVVVAIASALLLLPVVLPVLGYASWHLYRRAVV